MYDWVDISVTRDLSFLSRCVTIIYMAYRYIIGVDEVGRGPIAGPITVGAVRISVSWTWKYIHARAVSDTMHTRCMLKDSKKLTEKNREAWYAWVRSQKDISFAVASVSAARIDAIGIVAAGNEAARNAVKKLEATPKNSKVLLDYGLKIDALWTQEALVKGDEREVAIALASIMAKVTRDRYMVSMGKKFAGYGFESHKGYGTKLHYTQIRTHGICTLHRKSFLKSVH
jgi:ribonuclease HII